MVTALGGSGTSMLLGLLVLTGSVQLWEVFVLALAFGIFSALDAPIRTSFTSELVGKSDLPNAVSLNSANFNLGRLVGPALSGWLIALYGTGWSFLINGLSFLGVLCSLYLLRPDELHINQKPDRNASIRDGLTFVREHAEVKLVMITVFFAATFGLNFQIFNALMSTSEFGLGPAEFGGAGSVLAIGSLSAALLATRLENSRIPKRIVLAAVVFGSLVMVLSAMPSYASYLIVLPLAGASALTTFIFANSFVQTSTPANLRGRVMGIYLLIFMGGTPIGSPIIGALAGAIGIRPTVLLCGLIVVLSALWVAFQLRKVIERKSQGDAKHDAGDDDIQDAPEDRL